MTALQLTSRAHPAFTEWALALLAVLDCELAGCGASWLGGCASFALGSAVLVGLF